MKMGGMIQFRMIIGVLIAIGMMAGLPAGVAAQSDEGLVAEWHFDGDAKDSSGNRNDGTIYGATFLEGKFGKALSFDGKDDYVEVDDSDSLDLTSQLSIEGWIYARKLDLEIDGEAILGKHDSPRDTGYNIGLYGNKLLFQFGDGGGGWPYSGSLPSNTDLNTNTWYHVAVTRNGKQVSYYLNGYLDGSTSTGGNNIAANIQKIWIGRNVDIIGDYGRVSAFDGIIDEVRIYNRALSPEEIKSHYEGKQTSLTLTKTASPYSIKQGQTTTITLTIKNTGTTDIANIEVKDSIHRNFDLIGGDFPNPRKYDIIGKGESREILYMIKAKEGGTFNLDTATGIYADKDGNIQEVKSEPFSVKVISSVEGDVESYPPSEIGSPPVLLHGEKTDVVLGEDILLKLSAVNLITKPPMSVQVMIYPPSGMSVTGSEFVVSVAGIYTTKYTLNPGDGKDIEVHIKSNQVGDFNVKGRIVYYFGDDKEKAKDQTLNLPIKVRQQGPTPSSISPIPGFEAIMSISGILLVSLLKKKW